MNHFLNITFNFGFTDLIMMENAMDEKDIMFAFLVIFKIISSGIYCITIFLYYEEFLLSPRLN